ncbi:hypothetical protein C8R44DRAFT_791399 [Mycena epipterygia]|nr:hypothetical protein C8R44DRAFT_796320 [Mycena epipterygia]KAJ7117755.1 hypothetical protein C8R44DRAFT_791399 [Mycena epipterygia]
MRHQLGAYTRPVPSTNSLTPTSSLDTHTLICFPAGHPLAARPAPAPGPHPELGQRRQQHPNTSEPRGDHSSQQSLSLRPHCPRPHPSPSVPLVLVPLPPLSSSLLLVLFPLLPRSIPLPSSLVPFVCRSLALSLLPSLSSPPHSITPHVPLLLCPLPCLPSLVPFPIAVPFPLLIPVLFLVPSVSLPYVPLPPPPFHFPSLLVSSLSLSIVRHR